MTPADLAEARARRERSIWPPESFECEAKAGARVARLYPFMRIEGGVMTPQGQGTLLQAFSTGCQVQMLRGWATGAKGKRHRPVREFSPEELAPYQGHGARR